MVTMVPVYLCVQSTFKHSEYDSVCERQSLVQFPNRTAYLRMLILLCKLLWIKVSAKCININIYSHIYVVKSLVE